VTPAENHARALTDLLSTEAFRSQVAETAGLVEPGATEAAHRLAARSITVWAASSGSNLLTITAESSVAAEAQALVTATVSEFRERATAELQRDAEASIQYYSEQIAVAEATLNERSTALTAYLSENPRAADPRDPASLDPDYQALLSLVTTQAELVEDLKNSRQSVQLRQAAAPETEAAAFSVQDEPQLPAAPESVGISRRLGIPMAATVFGLLIGAAYIYVLYRTDHTIRTAEDLAGLPVPLLGTVPELNPARSWTRHTPLAWIEEVRNRDFARKTARSILAPEAGKQAEVTDR
jgi:hypothetical protein